MNFRPVRFAAAFLAVALWVAAAPADSGADLDLLPVPAGLFVMGDASSTHENHKRKILQAGEHGTVVSRTYTGKPSRILRNAYTERWQGREHEVLPMPWQRLWVEQLVTPARAAGMVDIANYPTGQVAGRIADVPNATEVVERLVAEAEEALNR